MFHKLTGRQGRRWVAAAACIASLFTAACGSTNPGNSASAPTTVIVTSESTDGGEDGSVATDPKLPEATDTGSTGGEVGGPVVVTATPAGDSVDVVAYADSIEATLLRTRSGAVTFTIRIPSGALPNDVTFTVTPATTDTGEPAMLVEPSGLALLRPARVSVTGIDDRLIAWGPTGTARLLPEANETDNSAPIVVLGGVATVHAGARPEATGTTGGDPIDQWAADEEEDESNNADGTYDEERKKNTLASVSNGPVCKPGDRKAAEQALAANRAGAALGATPAPPPACLDVKAKITVTFAGQVEVMGGMAQIDEVMSGGALLQPTDNGHEGDVPLAVQQTKFFREDICNTVGTHPEVMHVAASWSGEGKAQLAVTPKTLGTIDLACKNNVKIPGVEMMSGAMLQALANLTGGVMRVEAPITEGSFYIFSLLKSVEQVKEWRLAGRDWQSAVSGSNVRFTFTVDVVYSLPAA